eukprot:Selendium_serpulae@DN2463_c0_g1_i1.p2
MLLKKNSLMTQLADLLLTTWMLMPLDATRAGVLPEGLTIKFRDFEDDDDDAFGVLGFVGIYCGKRSADRFIPLKQLNQFESFEDVDDLDVDFDPDFNTFDDDDDDD